MSARVQLTVLRTAYRTMHIREYSIRIRCYMHTIEYAYMHTCAFSNQSIKLNSNESFLALIARAKSLLLSLPSNFPYSRSCCIRKLERMEIDVRPAISPF